MGQRILSEKIAQFIFEVDYGGLPLEVIDKAKQCLMDALGVAVLGSKFAASRIVGKTVSAFQSREEAVVIGTPYKASASLAALANSVSAHVADYDDTSVEFKGHPSCVIVPAVVAAAESVQARGQEVLLSVVVGNEVGSKLGQSMGGRHYQKGWHGTGTIGTIAAAAAVAKLFKLEPKQVIHALGVAASSAAGLRQNFGTMTKSWHAGHAAHIGVLSGVLAQNGFDASAETLEGENGFIRTFDGEGAIESFEKLGSPYSITGVAFKKYPSCAAIHPAVEAILRLMNKETIRPEIIASIKCYCCPSGLAALGREYPKTELEAKFSMEYCVATTLVRGRLGVAEFEDEALTDPEVRSAMTKVQVISDVALEEIAASNKVLSPTRVTLVTKDGREFNEMIIAARGGSTEPLTWSELEDKFRECVSGLIHNGRVNRILGLIHGIESLQNITDLTTLLRSMN
jgi:2-methylcitrate dehydratase PrpD